MANVCRLLVLLAVLIMPLGMSTAAAAPHHEPTASMPMQHCPGQGSKHESKAFAECTMACSATLPAADIRAGEPLPINSASIAPGLLPVLHGRYLDIATPPPKPS